jgi:hypothetical protein
MKSSIEIRVVIVYPAIFNIIWHSSIWIAEWLLWYRIQGIRVSILTKRVHIFLSFFLCC